MGPAEQDLRALGLAPHVIDVAADTIADVEVFPGDGLVAAHDSFAAAQVDDRVAVLHALDHAVDDLSDPVLVLFVLALPLSLADFSGDNLAGHLGLYPAELEGRQDFLVGLADNGLGVVAQGLGEAADANRLDGQPVFVREGLVIRNDPDHALQRGLAGLGVNADADVVFGAVTGAGTLLDGLFDGRDDHLAVDGFLARHRLGRLRYSAGLIQSWQRSYAVQAEVRQRAPACAGRAGGSGRSILRTACGTRGSDSAGRALLWRAGCVGLHRPAAALRARDRVRASGSVHRPRWVDHTRRHAGADVALRPVLCCGLA